jgi:SAM-dependent methyltransferase
MSVSFDEYAGGYRDEVEQSISFANVDHGHVTALKARHLLSLCDELLGPPAEQRVLDVGCGVGLTDALLVGDVGVLHGIDVSPDCTARAATTNPRASYAAFDGGGFPLADGAVDLVFAVCVLHHVPPAQRTAFAAELHRVVRPGGVVVVFEHNPLNPLTRVAVSRCEFDEGVTLSRRGTTTRLLERAGLHIERGSYIVFTPSARGAAGTDRIFGWCPAGAQYYVAARRPPPVPRAHTASGTAGRSTAPPVG